MKKTITISPLKVEDFLFNKYFKIDIQCYHNTVKIHEFSIYVDMSTRKVHPFIISKDIIPFLSSVKEKDERYITVSSTHAIGKLPEVFTLVEKVKYTLQDVQNYILLTIPGFYPYGENQWVENQLTRKTKG